MGTDRELELAFSSGRTGSGPATWGQHDKWTAMRALGDEANRYNIAGGMPLSTPLTVERLAGIVQELLLLHDSLRTRLRATGDIADRDPDGPPRQNGGLEQTAYAAGAVPVVARASEPDAVNPTAFALHDDLRARAFDCEHEWPLRLGIVESEGYVRYVIFCLPHTATDGWGLRNLLGDFASLVAGGSPTRGERLQPLEEAAFQHSERGRRMDVAARHSWREKLGRGPARLFPVHPERAPAETFPFAVLTSPALALAVEQVGSGLAVNPAAVLLAAAAAAAGRVSGVHDAVFQITVNNRFVPGLGNGVNTIAQEGLFHLRNTDDEFRQVVRRSFGATLSAQRNAYYDKFALDRDLAGLAATGAPGDLSCVINDVRGMLPGVFPKPVPAPLDALRAQTTLQWPDEFPPRERTTFAMDVQDAAGAVELAMTADTALIPRPDMERFLLDIEDLVVGQALALDRD